LNHEDSYRTAGILGHDAEETPRSLRDRLRPRLERLNSIPTIPAIIRPLLRYIQKSEDQIDMQRIVDMVSCDEAIAAQCLHVANSALYCRSREVRTIHGAVLVLGVRQVREILLSCSLLHLLPKENRFFDPVSFWGHSMGCALVSRKIASLLGYPNLDRAYLAGLLHDLGVIVNLIAFPQEYHRALEQASALHLSMIESETRYLGFHHGESGKILAEYWHLPTDLWEVISWHHDVQQAKLYPTLVALIGVSDDLCRKKGLGFGYLEAAPPDPSVEAAWQTLSTTSCPLDTAGRTPLLHSLEDFMTTTKREVHLLFKP
jgi:HD-like signal output (HDOD) protein